MFLKNNYNKKRESFDSLFLLMYCDINLILSSHQQSLDKFFYHL